MKTKRNTKKISIITLIIGAVIALGYDLSTSTLIEIRSNSFKLESEFDAVTGPTTPVKVAVVTSDYSGLDNQVSRDIDPGYEQIEAMVRKAIELQGGFTGVIDAGDTIMLKVNLVGGNSPSGQGENTDVRVVKALMKTIYDFQNDVHIVVAEGTARTNDDFNEEGSVWHNSGYVDLLSDTYLAGISYSFLNLNQTINDLLEINLGSDGTAEPHDYTFHVHKKEVTADVYISVPVLKIHNPGITCALKNQIGTAPGCYYGYNKMKQLEKDGSTTPSKLIHDKTAPQDWTAEEIVDLSRIAGIDFVVVDAVMCLQTSKGYNGTNQLRMNTVIAGYDPVSVDNVCTRLLGLNPDDIDHICLAEKMGMGTNDEESIDVVGVPIADAMKKAKKSLSNTGRFGRSNRTWILSPAFNGNDISYEHIEDEANYNPVAGKDNWSQPVYFFDDQIDLYSYYYGGTNIITYAFTNFYSPSDTTAELWLGNHEAIRVYVNNSLAYEFTSIDNYEEGEYGEKVANINIKEGENSLLVKTLNTYGSYTFALNICEVESDINFYGNRIKGLKFYIPEGVETKACTNILVDAAVCPGDTYFAGGSEQSKPGIYYDTITGEYVDTVYVTKLSLLAAPNVYLGSDKTITKPDSLKLTAGYDLTKTYLWSTGDTNTYIYVNSENETETQKDYWVIVTDDKGCTNSDTITFTFEAATGIIPDNLITNQVKLHPNPFTVETNISFTLPEALRASIHIYDMQGRMVKTIENRHLAAGLHNYTWDGTSDNNSEVQKGIYICTMRFGTNIKSIKIQKN